MIKIIAANNTEHFNQIATLADIIWREYYIPIIGLSQVNYMLYKFQSATAIDDQVKNGYEYFIINFKEEAVGYISVKKERDVLFLSKIYISSLFRGKKIGKTALIFVEEKAKTYNLNKIRLTVNINNLNSIKAYEKLGFKKVGPIKIDIGNGFVMDDFEMVKEI